MPVRSCLGCRARREKNDLLRWVTGPGGEAVPDPAARMPGRGRYVCRQEACFDRLLKGAAKRGWDFTRYGPAFRLAIRGDVVQNVPVEKHEN